MPDRIINRLRRAFRNQPRDDVRDPMTARSPDDGMRTAAQPARVWRVHPAIPELMDLLGIGSAVTPGDDDRGVSRIQRPGGGYWRVEYVTGADGVLDHLIEVRRNDDVPIPRLLTQDGILEMDVRVAIPDTLVDGLPGRRLGDIVEVRGLAAGMVITAVERRVYAQTQPQRVRFEPQEHVPVPDDR